MAQGQGSSSSGKVDCNINLINGSESSTGRPQLNISISLDKLNPDFVRSLYELKKKYTANSDGGNTSAKSNGRKSSQPPSRGAKSADGKATKLKVRRVSGSIWEPVIRKTKQDKQKKPKKSKKNKKHGQDQGSKEMEVTPSTSKVSKKLKKEVIVKYYTSDSSSS